MLKRFTVTNFMNFENTATFELDKPANYGFNGEIVKNGIITKGMVYGINGSGKSNLALAIFDIVIHLTDKERCLDKYALYMNLNSKRPTAEFEYVFEFNGMEVIYRYEKKDPMSLRKENLYIGGKEVLQYDYAQNSGYTVLKGAETLQFSSVINQDNDRLSRVKYVRNNALLMDDDVNRAFVDFVSFVDNMLMFYSLDQNRYQGFTVGSDSYTQGIIRAGKVNDFEVFLKEHGIDYELVVVEDNGHPEIYCRYDRATVPFVRIASTGTRSLALFYYWYIRLSAASFVYIDEYDAFYHYELSQELVELLKELTDVQVILSTHNTDLLSNDIFRPDAYFLIENNTIRSFEKTTPKELRRAHNMQKMFKAGTFNE